MKDLSMKAAVLKNKKTPKMSKSLQKMAKSGTDNFVNDLYFNPKKREKLRQSFDKSRDNFLKILEQPQKTNPTDSDTKDRYWAGVFSDQMSGLIDVIDNVVPRKIKEIELTNAHFKLFKKSSGNFIVIECKYDKDIPKKHYMAYLLIPFGFPRKGKRTKAQIKRGGYDLKNFALQDEGTFTQKFISFAKVRQTFKGKNGAIRLELTQRGKIKDNNWLRIL